MWPFTPSKRTIREAELIGRADHYATKAADEAAGHEAAVANVARLTREIDHRDARLAAQAAVIADLRKRLDAGPRAAATTRLHRALKACAGYRRELAAQHRVADRLSEQLMHSMGYTSSGLELLGVVTAETEVSP